MNFLTRNTTVLNKSNARNIWGWVNYIFNRVDESRIKQVGPDRACAEWLLRNGASVKWTNAEEYLKDYNALPVEGTKKFIKEVDASESSIMHYGFRHFKNCKHIDKVILHKCSYLENEAMPDLAYLNDNLQHLQISSCGNITTPGLLALQVLKNLKRLDIQDLAYVKDKKAVLDSLQKNLPNCNVTFT